MGPFDRGIMLVYTLTVTLLFLVIMVFLAGWQEPLLQLWREIVLPGHREIIWALLVLYFLMGARLLWTSLKVKRKKHAVVHDGELGDVRVALPAIESLVEKVAFSVQGIKDARARVEAVPQGIDISLKLFVSPSVNIPAVSEDLQRRVRDSVYSVAGIAVREVRVAVESFTSRKTRVE